MRVLMLGWEFPPYISGGLGTACFGLTKALNRQKTEVIFVLPRLDQPSTPTHVKIVNARHVATTAAVTPRDRNIAGVPDLPAMERVTFRTVPSKVVSPYQSAGGRVVSVREVTRIRGQEHGNPAETAQPGDPADKSWHVQEQISFLGDSSHHQVGEEPYSGDVLAEAQRYSLRCLQLARREKFDVIHAHDWMTYPAGLAVAAATGKPLVVHVHSTEYDRSGDNVNRAVADIERRGMQGACRVITVSFKTRGMIEQHYHVAPERIDVVYNGIDNGNYLHDDGPAIRKSDKVVLFLGRVTFQKGPDYFIQAARRVLERMDNVKFVMAGSGDMVTQIIDHAAAAGIGHKFIFTGFLRGRDVDRVFRMADVYVMPSVSEPFGIAPLEAISHDVPVIISKQSGVSEVLRHALKVDFWDIDDIADKIIAVLRHPPLSSTLREHADLEVRRLTWDDAARKCQEIYRHAVAMVA